jgi:hypothetical protein
MRKVESRIGVRKPPAMPRIATAIAFRRTASRNAIAVNAKNFFAELKG